MLLSLLRHGLCWTLLLGSAVGAAADPPAAPADVELARKLGADERGMRQYVLVILKSGPQRMPDGDARRAMFAGHFANMARLSEQGRLALAGPFGPNDSEWRGLFIMATGSIEEARSWTETDPVIVNGEMVAEYVQWYGSAALMQVAETHRSIAPQAP